AAARAAARATARDRGRGGAGITGTSAGAGGSIRRDDLTVVAADQQAEGGLRDGDAHGPDAAVPVHELADALVVTAEPLIGGGGQVRNQGLPRPHHPGEHVD